MPKPKLTPQTPGEPVAETTTDTAAAPAADSALTTEPVADQATDTTDTAASEPPAPAATATAPEAPLQRAPGALPDETDIDPKAIERPVLTKQGWVVPAK